MRVIRGGVPPLSAPAVDLAIDMAIEAIYGDPLFAATVVALAEKAEEERRRALESWDFWWNDLTPQDRAKVVDAFRDGLGAAEVARRSGASERSVYRWRKTQRHGRGPRSRPAGGFKDATGHLDAWMPSDEDPPGWQP